MGKTFKLSEKDWKHIGSEMGWVKSAKMYNRVCAWCNKLLGEPLQDNIEPKDDWGVDTHGICEECKKKLLAQPRKKQI